MLTTKLSQKTENSNTHLSILNFNPSIDSLKIRIPIDDVNVLHPSLGEELTLRPTVNSTGEQLKDRTWKDNAHKEVSEHTSCYYSIGELGGSNRGQKYLFLGIHSKQLGTKEYFNGITSDNLKNAYGYIIRQKVVSFSYDSFINAKCVDWDIKQDIVFPNFAEKRKDIAQLSKYSKQGEKGYKPFNGTKDKPSCGLQWANRKTTAFATNPFLKMYHKGIELQIMHLDFYIEVLKYLDNEEKQQLNDLVRIEITIKNKDHMKHIGLKIDNSLLNIVSLQYDKLSSILRIVASSHFEKKSTLRILKAKKSTPTQRAWMIMIHTILQKGMSFEELKWNILMGEEKQSKYHLNIRLNKIYDLVVAEDKVIEKENIDLESMYKMSKILGIN